MRSMKRARLVGIAFIAAIAVLVTLALRWPVRKRDGSEVTGPPSTLSRAGEDSQSAKERGEMKHPPRSDVPIVVPPSESYALKISKHIDRYIAGDNRAMWLRMFRELLDISIPRETAVRLLKGYLNHSEALIRYAAAKNLYRIGHRSGSQVLIQLVVAPNRIGVPGVDDDLRLWAAMTLAEYRDPVGREAVAALYFATKDLNARKYAVRLGARQMVPEILAAMKEKVWKDQLEDLGFLHAIEAKPIIAEQFEKEGADIGLRVEAAAAMTRLGEAEPYLSFLLGVASEYAADDPVRGDEKLRAAGEAAIRRIGSSRNDAARQFFEMALDSENQSVVQLALVNLRVNYAESAKARELLLKALQGSTKLGATTVYRLASMTDDLEVRRTAADRNPMLWQKAALHEKHWDKDVWLRAEGARQ
jgi:hypothetical protein